MNELYHHGIKGQKWGVRKERSSASNRSAKAPKKRLSPRTKRFIKNATILAGEAAIAYMLLKNQNKLEHLIYSSKSKKYKEETNNLIRNMGPVIINRKTGEVVDDGSNSFEKYTLNDLEKLDLI